MSKARNQVEQLPTHEEDPLLNLSEVARQLGKSQPTIRRWIVDGLMQAHRLPSGLYAVRQSAVNIILKALGKDAT